MDRLKNTKVKARTRSQVYAVGETVFDIIFRDFKPVAAKPGGSSFNAMISLGRLGIPCSFISEVGNDKIGSHILNFLSENGVGNEYVSQKEGSKSALSLAFLNNTSDAEYDFYKDYPNHRMESALPYFREQDYFLFGSFYGLNPVLRPRMEELLESASKKNVLIYYDPNFRSSHLDDLHLLKGFIQKNLLYSSIVRASDEDIYNIYGIDNADDAWKKISRYCGVLIYTKNAHGVDLRSHKFSIHIDVDRIEPVSTIGAGDTFNAGIIYGLYRRNITNSSLEDLDIETWKQIMKEAAILSKEVCMSYENYIPKGFADQLKKRM